MPSYLRLEPLELVDRLDELRGRPPLRPFFRAALALASLLICPIILGAHSQRLRASAMSPVRDA
jgi:hypothetical protein